MRLPRPDLMKPNAKRKALTISQIVALPKPLKASAGLTTFGKPVRPTEISAIAPIGRGCRIKPTMVATKMANICIAWGFKPAGTGRNHNTKPTATVKIPFWRLVFKLIHLISQIYYIILYTNSPLCLCFSEILCYWLDSKVISLTMLHLQHIPNKLVFWFIKALTLCA